MWFIGVEVEQETSAPLPKKNPGSAPAKGSYLLDTGNYCNCFNLSQLVPRSTRVTKTTELSIDVIITSNPHQVIETGVMPSSISDHGLPYVVIIQYNTIQYNTMLYSRDKNLSHKYLFWLKKLRVRKTSNCI